MAGTKQGADHTGPHLSESNKSDLHEYRLALSGRNAGRAIDVDQAEESGYRKPGIIRDSRIAND